MITNWTAVNHNFSNYNGSDIQEMREIHITFHASSFYAAVKEFQTILLADRTPTYLKIYVVIKN